MTLLAILLASIGAADLVRPTDVAPGRARAALSIILGSAIATLLAWGCGLAWWLVPLAIVIVAAWVLLTPRLVPWPLLGLGMLAIACVALNPLVPAPAGWLREWYTGLDLPALYGIPFSRFLLGAGVALFLISSANIVVRMALAATDARTTQPGVAPRGGRVLGPIERIFIFALALSGEFLAITAVIAGKGILRFPEISGDPSGTKAEYVLVGSFVSYGLALVFVPLF